MGRTSLYLDDLAMPAQGHSYLYLLCLALRGLCLRYCRAVGIDRRSSRPRLGTELRVCLANT